jgi:hypothetical protein
MDGAEEGIENPFADGCPWIENPFGDGGFLAPPVC